MPRGYHQSIPEGNIPKKLGRKSAAPTGLEAKALVLVQATDNVDSQNADPHCKQDDNSTSRSKVLCLGCCRGLTPVSKSAPCSRFPLPLPVGEEEESKGKKSKTRGLR